MVNDVWMKVIIFMTGKLQKKTLRPFLHQFYSIHRKLYNNKIGQQRAFRAYASNQIIISQNSYLESDNECLLFAWSRDIFVVAWLMMFCILIYRNDGSDNLRCDKVNLKMNKTKNHI